MQRGERFGSGGGDVFATHCLILRGFSVVLRAKTGARGAGDAAVTLRGNSN
ncbi:hypothetical protein SSBG_05744 [Streptomyces sp. SPB074]|nr:hypothetical protein SSBG_05744 [Streptomyces sp. SPB074]